MTQWTYVYWDSDSYMVMRQVPDATVQGRVQGRVHSTVIAKGVHQMTSLPYTNPAYYHQYASVQRQIGNQYATEEWPLRTCVDFDSKKGE